MRFLITAGGTREYIDPVRFISNASSGKMGYALTLAAQKADHKVTLISASDLQPPVGVEFVGVDSAKEMFESVKEFFAKCDCLIMAAAVADYTPQRKSLSKLKKKSGPLTLKLQPTADILSWAGHHKNPSQIVIGFCLETENLKANAEIKLKQKNLDMIIANVPEAIGSDKSTVWLKTVNEKWVELKNTAKDTLAAKVIRIAENLPRR